MAISLQSFSNLFGRVNDGHFVLKGEGDQATVQRVNRGQSAFTRAVVYKQVDLTTEAAKADNLRTRQALRDALVGDEGNTGYRRFVEEKLGLNDNSIKMTPLRVRDVKALIDGQEADRLAHANEPRYGEDGYTIIDGLDPRENPPPQDEQDLAAGLQGQAVEQEVEPDAVEEQPEENPVDETEKLFAERQAEFQKARDAAKAVLTDTCAKFLDTLVDELEKGFLPCVDDNGNILPEKKPVDDQTRELLKITLAKSKAAYFSDVVDEPFDVLDAPYEEELEQLRANDLLGDGDKAADETVPLKLRWIDRKIADANALVGDTELMNEMKHAIGRRLTQVHDLIQQGLEANKTKYVSGDDFCRMAREAELSVTKNDFLMHLGDAFGNVTARKDIETRFVAKLQELTDEARKLSERTDEDPALAEDVRAFVEQNRASVMAHVNGPVDGPRFDRRAAGAQLDKLAELTRETFRARFELAERRLEIRQDILRKGGVLDHIERAKRDCGKVLSAETQRKLHELVTRPQGELKKQVDAAIDAHLKGVDFQSQKIGFVLQEAFDKAFAKLLAAEEKAGADILMAQKEDYRKKAESFFTPGHPNQLSSLEKLSFFDVCKEEDGKGPYTELWNTVKQKAFDFGFEKLMASRPTKDDLETGLVRDKIEQEFRKNVRDFAYRANHEMVRFDATVSGNVKVDKDFMKKLGMTYVGATWYLNKAEEKAFEDRIDTLRAQFTLKGGADEKVNYFVMVGLGDYADIRNYLAENVGKLKSL